MSFWKAEARGAIYEFCTFVYGAYLGVVLVCLASCGRETVTKVESSDGYIFVVLADYNTDGISIPMELEVQNAEGVLLHEFGPIDFVDPAMLRERPMGFAVYEFDGVVALYEQRKPELILAISDFSSGVYYPSVGSGDFVKHGELSGRIQRMKHGLGILEMELKKYR